ncbi:hypothetical protein Egran_00127 [Elaphomyces granulatus]|uniref:Enoyl reductase (ER) domain-containing protein n=1 Tax=Elaphomyces granulatus TaxID=519963 RepID=A0A232M754_9EURO|nr:hypothetical protein Egran_00127 [Elaphomyces granulatus]
MSNASNLPSAMRAWLWTDTAGGLEKNIRLEEAASPPGQTLRQDQVLIQVISASLNPADYKVPEMGFIIHLAVSTPATPGMDFCGRVIATGSAVQGYEQGQLVYGSLGRPVKFGALAEYVVSSVSQIAPVPSGVHPDHAASIGIAGQTAYQSIQPNVSAGDHIFINAGSGGCGVFAIQIAKILGCHVTVSCSTRNIQFCRDLGADEVIDYTSVDIVQALKEKGQVFNLVVDHIGVPANLYQECHHFLAPRKGFVQVGSNSILTFVDRLLRPSLFGGGKRWYQIFIFRNVKSQLIQLGEWIHEGKIKVPLDSTFEFEDAVQAFKKLKTHRARGKIVIHVAKKAS